MVPLAYDDQHLVPLDSSCPLSTSYSLTHHSTGEEQNHKPVAEGQLLNNEASVPPVIPNKKIQNCSVLPSDKSNVTYSQDFDNRPTKSSSSQSTGPGTISSDCHQRSSLSPHGKDTSSFSSHLKPKTTTSSKVNNTSSLLETNQTSLSARLHLLKPQASSSSQYLCCKSPSLRSNYRVSSSLSTLQPQETPSLNTIWTAPSFPSTQRAPSSTLLPSASRKFPSLDCLRTWLRESRQRSLSSPVLNKLRRNDFLPTSPKPAQMAPNSPSHDSRPQKMLSSKANVLTLPKSHLKSRKSPFLSHTKDHQSQSLPLFKAKSQMPLRLDHHFKALSSPGCRSKLQPTSSPNVTNRAKGLTPFHHGPTPKTSGQTLWSTKPYMRNPAVSTGTPRFQSKCSFEFNVTPQSDNETPWALDYSHPCIVKGGTVPVDTVNKIVNSISKTTIQKDLSRQILLRRMRGRPNPRPGPRLSSSYSVCLDCASCIKSQCCHLTGKKDPRGATLFVIPTPEAGAEGKKEVKIVFILSLPEMSASPWFPLPMKENQPDEDPNDDNLEEMEKITQFFPASESDNIHGLKGQKEWVPGISGNKDGSQQLQAIDWLFYVKQSNNYQPQSQLPSSSCSSGLSSSCSSASSSSSSSNSSSAFPTLPSLSKVPSYSPSDNVCPKELSDHRLPPGVSWLEFISSKDYQLLSGKSNGGHSPGPKRQHVRNCITKKGTKGSNKLLKYFQMKFQHRKSSLY